MHSFVEPAPQHSFSSSLTLASSTGQDNKDSIGVRMVNCYNLTDPDGQ